MTIVLDVIPVAPWQVLDPRRRDSRVGHAGIHVILDARARDVADVRGGVRVAVERPDGSRGVWVVSAVEVLHDVPALFLAGASVADVPPGSRLSWRAADAADVAPELPPPAGFARELQ
jgi:hypothetical protein